MNNCPYLITPIVSTCLAGDKPYIPSAFQLQEYCKNKQSTKCHLLGSALIRGKEQEKRVMEKAERPMI